MQEYNFFTLIDTVILLETTLAGKLPGLVLFVIGITILGVLYDMLKVLFGSKKLKYNLSNYRTI